MTASVVGGSAILLQEVIPSPVGRTVRDGLHGGGRVSSTVSLPIYFRCSELSFLHPTNGAMFQHQSSPQKELVNKIKFQQQSSNKWRHVSSRSAGISAVRLFCSVHFQGRSSFGPGLGPFLLWNRTKEHLCRQGSCQSPRRYVRSLATVPRKHRSLCPGRSTSK